MQGEVVRYLEQLNDDEISFLKRKEQKERSQFYNAIRFLMVLCFLIPFAAAWIRAFKGAPNAFSFTRYFIGVGGLLALTFIAAYISWFAYLHRTQRDLQSTTKTIERVHVVRKQYMPQNNTYYFYLDSPTKLSIEVGEKDYHKLELGDEVNIEYTTHSRMYLGYF